MRDFEAAPRRGRMEAWLLERAADFIHVQYGERKSTALGALTGTVVELGPGVGANLRYYGPGVRVIGIEPNPAMHPRLRAEATRLGVDLEIRTLRGEHLDVGDGSADAVVGTLVLCSVDEPAAVVEEVRRVLRPGGRYFFLEHVGAPKGTTLARVQSAVKAPHRWLLNGCEVDRDTASLLRRAGFSELDLTEVAGGPKAFYTRPHIVGTATR